MRMIHFLFGVPVVFYGLVNAIAPSLAKPTPSSEPNTPQAQIPVLVAQKPANYPVVKSASLDPNLNIPWSQPVTVADPFEGNFVAVFDRNNVRFRDLGGSGKLVSLWSQDFIRVLLAAQQKSCSVAYNFGFSSPSVFPYRYNGYPYRSKYPYRYGRYPYGYRSGLSFGIYSPVCVGFNTPIAVHKLLLKVDDQVLELEGENSVFPVSDEVATALKNAPEKNADIRLVLEGGETVDSEIGRGTVNAWKVIY